MIQSMNFAALGFQATGFEYILQYMCCMVILVHELMIRQQQKLRRKTGRHMTTETSELGWRGSSTRSLALQPLARQRCGRYAISMLTGSRNGIHRSRNALFRGRISPTGSCNVIVTHKPHHLHRDHPTTRPTSYQGNARSRSKHRENWDH